MPHAAVRRTSAAVAASLILFCQLRAQDEVRALWVVRTTLTSPSAIASVAVIPDLREAATHRLQDWRGWLDTGLIDVICPMADTTDPAVFAAQIAAAKQIAGSHPLWAGIGAYRLSSDQIVENAQTARRLGVGGIILFSYDSLADSAHGPGFVSRVGRAAFQ